MQDSYRKISAGYLLFLLAVVVVAGYTPTNDGDGYIALARLSLGDGMPYPSPASIHGQPFVWNIGQICMVEASLWLFGSVIPVLVLNCVLKALTAYVVALMAKRLFNEKAGLLALVIYAAYPNNWGDCTMLLSEIPAIALALTALYITLTRRSSRMWLLAGLLFAVSNWVRPASPVYIGSLLLCHLIFNRKGIVRRYACLFSTYVAFIVVIGMGSWLRTGYFVYQADTLWFNMAEATYETDTRPHYNAEVYPPGTARYIEDMRHKDAPECSAIYRERDLAWLRTHKAAYLEKLPGRLFWMYYTDVDNVSAFLKDKGRAELNYVTLPYSHILTSIPQLTGIQRLAAATWAAYLLIMLTAACGFCTMAFHRQWPQLFLMAMIVVGGSLAIVLATHGEPRFKAPFMPFVIILSAHFLSTRRLCRAS